MPDLQLTAPKKNIDVISRTVDGEAVLVLPGAGEVIVLNETGSLIWDHIDGDRSAGALSQSVANAFEVELDQATQDTHEFLETLIGRGAITID
jgi:hypothetical protein